MTTITFYKLQASGNDFILIDNRKTKLKAGQLKKLARKYCQRKLSIGADGLLVIESSKKASFRMRIFNADGSEAEMCGNGARCTAYWAKSKAKQVKFETQAGIIEACLKADRVAIKLSDPKQIKVRIPIVVLGRKIHLNFINTGVPHVVIFVSGLDKIDVEKIGRAVRFHKKFQPAGTNVNFVEIINDNFVRVRTYERGVEAETLACGTGSVAAAILLKFKLKVTSGNHKVRVLTKSQETLSVHFSKIDDKVRDVWLKGKADLVCQGSLKF
ncbi:MAG: diaminopimelate epimerase [Candidatus Omnitrophica bacterium]|nr:diaminopimelate epimerase [Candidatus Omnitrophota bacterium]